MTAIEERLRNTVYDLSETIGPRAPGSSDELRAAEYIAGRLEEIGIEPSIESFESGSHHAIGSMLEQISGEGSKTHYVSLPSQFSVSGDVSGPLMYLGECETALDRSAAVSDRIGLIIPNGGHPRRAEILRELERRGMQAVVVVSPHINTIDTKLFRYPEVGIPVISVSYQTAVELRKSEGESFRIIVETDDGRTGESRNVVAMIPGSSERWLVLAAHIDTAPFSPGASDNASGVAVVLEAARRLVRIDLRASIVLLFPGSEEFGANDGTGRGAQAFFRNRIELLETCIGYVDVDSVGDYFSAPKLFVCGPNRFRNAALSDELRSDYAVIPRFGAGGDHGAAEDHGVPSLWFNDNCFEYSPQLHTPEDTIDIVDFAAVARIADDVTGVVERLSGAEPFFRWKRNGEIVVRPARADDTDSICEITKQSFGPVSGDLMRQDFFDEKLGGTEWHEYKNEAMRDFVDRHVLRTIVAVVEDKVVGYATYSLDERRGIAEIGNNAVDPGFQRRGIGSMLQEEIDRRMRAEGYSRFTVSTLSVDLPARRIYEKLGYSRSSETIHYLRKG